MRCDHKNECSQTQKTEKTLHVSQTRIIHGIYEIILSRCMVKLLVLKWKQGRGFSDQSSVLPRPLDADNHRDQSQVALALSIDMR